MIRIDTYLRSRGRLVSVEELDCKLADDRYIEGAMELTIGGVAIITRAEADLVDQLWSYITDKTAEALAGRAVYTLFPDQPIKLELVPHGQRTLIVRLTYPGVERTAQTDTLAFVAELQRAGHVFWAQIARFSKQNARMARDEIGYLDALTR